VLSLWDRENPWADPSTWSHGDLIATFNDTNYIDPNISFYYGTWTSTTAQVHGIACYYDIRQGRANITYDLSSRNVTSVQLSKANFDLLPNMTYASPWYGTNIYLLLPNRDVWKTVLNDTPEASIDTALGSVQLAYQISDLHNHFYTQYYNVVLRDQNFTANTTHANVILIDKNWQRIVQSALSTRILQVLLLVMWLCACIIYWLFDVKTLLPKNPCSIAAQASLLADSKFLDMIPEGAENATLEELMQMTPFKGHLFSMGWWDDGNGGRRFGIDIGMADFDRGEDEVEKAEESEEGRGGVEEIEEGLIGKVDARVSVDIVGSRV
jgi:hypothetical protein